MEKALTNLQECYRLLGQITVSGENVLLLAAAITALRAAYNALTQEEKTDEAADAPV